MGGAGAISGGDSVNTAAIATALGQLVTAKTALNAMATNTTLLPTIGGNVTLKPAVYGATALTFAANSVLTLDGGEASNPIWVFNIPTYLVTGANTEIKIINAGTDASVEWNTGGYTTLRADS
ncbi:ice-binding family protein, partial [Roseateles sp. GG27B]